MSKTPRTDRKEWTATVKEDGVRWKGIQVVNADFARLLEEENERLREALREGIETREQVGYMRQMAALQVWEERARRLIDKGE